VQMLNSVQIVRLWVFSACVLWTGAVNAQKLEIKYKVQQGSIHVKWLPSNYFALRKMSEGATITRIVSNAKTNLKGLDYSNGVTWRIVPLKERFDALDLNDSLESSYAMLLEPVVNWVADREQQNFAFGSNVIMNVTDPEVQKLLGNLIVDTEFDASKSYVYRVEVTGVPTAYVAVDASEFTVYPKIKTSLVLDQHKDVAVSWNYTQLQNDAFAFDVLHAEGDTSEVTNLLGEPYFPFTTDTYNSDSAMVRHENPKKGVLHYYRVTGRDPFGESTLQSKWLSIYVPDKINAYPIIDSINAEGKKRMVNASIHGVTNKSNVKFAALLRSKEKESGYEMLEVKTYSGDSLLQFNSEVENETGDAFYYKVALVNKDDSITSMPKYFFTLDQHPPEPPTDLHIEIDSNGIATLSWIAPKDEDIKGYRVFRANDNKEEFIEQTTMLVDATSFEDTLALNNLSSEVYYFIKTVDNNYNNSVSSDTVLGLKPDTIAPAPSIIKSANMVEHGVTLDFILSSSKDAHSTELYRNNVFLTAVDSAFIDTTALPGAYYTYYLVTTDRSGNTAISKSVSQKYEPGFRAAPSGSIEADFESSRVAIKVDLPEEDVYEVRFYKAAENQTVRLWKTTTRDEAKNMTDRNVSVGSNYTYKIVYVTNSGIHSLPLELQIQY